MFTLNTLTLFWNFSKLPTFVPPLFTYCTRATVLQNCHTWLVHVLFTFCSSVATLQQVLHICHTCFCSRFVRLVQNCHCCKNVTVAKLPQTPRVCELISCCLSPFWGEILNICHFVTIGHLRLSYTPLTKLQKTCIIVLNTTAYAR